MQNDTIINVRNEIDRFGFSNYLAKKMNMKKLPRSHANWLHGWYWGPTDIQDLDCILGYPKKYNFNIPTIVTNHALKNTLINNGLKNVYAGGIPFCYIDKSNKFKKKDSILIILPHSLNYTEFSKDDNLEEIFYSISLLKKKFDKIDCLTFYDDYIKKNFDKYFRKYNLNSICGARSNQINSLEYIRSIFDSYEYVTSNCMGSSILYAMYCGCKVSIMEPYFEYSTKFWLSDPHLKNNKFLVDKMIYLHSISFIKKKYGFLFLNNPIKAKTNFAWAKNEIGYENIIPYKDLKKILGWTYFSKIKATKNYLLRKLII